MASISKYKTKKAIFTAFNSTSVKTPMENGSQKQSEALKQNVKQNGD